jgi:ABC-type amino acid transport substrate-binding protein
MSRWRQLACLALVSALGLAFATPPPALGASTAEVKQRGRLVVLSFPHSLSSFMRLADGGYVGVDYDLMRSFASRLGVQLEVKPVPRFEDLIPSLRGGKGDVIASSFSITTPRRELVDFTASYFPVLVFAMARKGIAISGPADLAGKNGCVVAGSSQEERMDRLAQVRKHYVKSSGECWDVVADGGADFTLLDSTAALAHMDEHPGVVKAFHLPEAEHYGFAVTRGNDLRAEIDAFIAEARKSGFLYQVVRRHFGEQGAELFRLVK